MLQRKCVPSTARFLRCLSFPAFKPAALAGKSLGKHSWLEFPISVTIFPPVIRRVLIIIGTDRGSLLFCRIWRYRVCTRVFFALAWVCLLVY